MKRLLLLPLLLACFVSLSDACAPVTFVGERVAIASETALIVYDEKTETEHFIRRGTFETKVPYFGFLVPTPTVPDLGEMPDELFDTLGDWTKPRIVTQTVKRPRTWDFAKSGEKKEDRAPGGVAVLGEGNVAGFEYKILSADTAADLKKWLDEHSYVTRPDLEQWLQIYLDKKYVITAFQMKKPEQGKEAPGLRSKAVRMSFRTKKPFYPYLEPEAQRAEGAFRPDRLLRVYYVSTSRGEGSLEGKQWQGRAAWAKPLEANQQQVLADKLRDKNQVALTMPQSAWLTEFEDRSSPRPGGSDLYFAPSADQATLERPPIIHTVYVDEEESSAGSVARVVVISALGVIVLATLAFLLWRSTARKPG